MRARYVLMKGLPAISCALLLGCQGSEVDPDATATAVVEETGRDAISETEEVPYEVVVLSGLDATIAWLESEDWWGEENHEEQLSVPRALITSIGPRWREAAGDIPVETKKEVFYRFMLPLVMHANVMVLDRRARLERMAENLRGGNSLSADDIQWLADGAAILRIVDSGPSAGFGSDPRELERVIDEALYKLDVIPPALALGQAAYESGYGTSRFAVEGNALFGEWTFGDTGLVPERQRDELGDHRIAAFDWPFDSVRSYFINLSAHPAYEELRRLRADLKQNGQPIDSLTLADGLIRYSERGQEYVDTLKGIIRVNNLLIADDATFREEPLRFLVGAEDEADAERIRAEIETMRASGELDAVVERMDLD